MQGISRRQLPVVVKHSVTTERGAASAYQEQYLVAEKAASGMTVTFLEMNRIFSETGVDHDE